MTRYNTNLAAEFYALSMLYRLGADAALTLGNKKAVDIIVTHEDGTTTTIDVKGVAGRYDWPADNIRLHDKPHHFYAFVCFEGKIAEPEFSPNVWVVPSNQLEQFLTFFKTRVDVSRVKMKANGQRFYNNWASITGQEAS